ncbi:hypothetical protein K501DRAFT_273696 [Backusella circina FSU 941]|nr:hypothetical protein K501DRAFT_273696 [Backusella circina FSU 941]
MHTLSLSVTVYFIVQISSFETSVLSVRIILTICIVTLDTPCLILLLDPLCGELDRFNALNRAFLNGLNNLFHYRKYTFLLLIIVIVYYYFILVPHLFYMVNLSLCELCLTGPN